MDDTSPLRLMALWRSFHTKKQESETWAAVNLEALVMVCALHIALWV
jgi:hypothetical protein